MEDLIAWAGRAELRPVAGLGGDILRLASMERAYSIAYHHGIYPVELCRRGRDRVVIGAFEDLDDARRFLVIEVGALVREKQQMPQLSARELPPGFVIEELPTALWLSWFTGSAEFPIGERSRRRAMNFSRVERAPLDAIETSFLEPAGRPFYDAA
ncbi:MAG: Immunity protein 61 [Microbacteriaceae bacterium]|nr:Immunity protein 61 [Microbacteriaceae bacterium]